MNIELKENYLKIKTNKFGPKMKGKNNNGNGISFLSLYSEFETLFFMQLSFNRKYKRFIDVNLSKEYWEVYNNIFLSTEDIEDIIYEVYLDTDFPTIYDDYDLKNSQKESAEIEAIGMNYFLDIFHKKEEAGEYYFNMVSDAEFESKKKIYEFQKKDALSIETKKILNKSELITKENKNILLSNEMAPYYYYVGETSELISDTCFYFFASPHHIKITEDRGGEIEYRPLYARDFFRIKDKSLYPVVEKENILYYLDTKDLRDLFIKFLNKDIEYIFSLSFGYMLYKQPSLNKTISYGSLFYHSSMVRAPFWQEFCLYVFTEIQKGEINCVKLPKQTN